MISAAQWWICRNTNPARTSNDRCSTDWYAADIFWPLSGVYGPWYTTWFAFGT